MLNSLTRTGLQTLIIVCRKYSLKWRFFYKDSKCLVIIYIDKPSLIRNVNSWTFADGEMMRTTKHKHLGVVESQSLRQPADVSAIKQTLRGTFLSSGTCGLHAYGINPISSIKLYTSIVLPKALYSCELWNNIDKTTMTQLEIAHRFCVKFCQDLPRITRTDIALGLMGITSIEAFIDLQKLDFLGTLCHANSTFIVKYLFTFRLHQYRLNSRAIQKGFISDLNRLLRKNSLENYLNNYISCGTSPSKAEWKRYCKTTIWNYKESAWRKRIAESDEFT